jgi:hypothetical protein
MSVRVLVGAEAIMNAFHAPWTLFMAQARNSTLLGTHLP